MKLRLYRTFGEIEIEAAEDKDVIAQASFWSELPDECPECRAGLFLHYRETPEKGFKYYELHCRGDVQHRTQFGQYTAGGLFYKRKWEALQLRDHDDSERERRDAEWKSPLPAEPQADRFAGDEQIGIAHEAIRRQGADPWRPKPDEQRDQYLARLRRQYTELTARGQ